MKKFDMNKYIKENIIQTGIHTNSINEAKTDVLLNNNTHFVFTKEGQVVVSFIELMLKNGYHVPPHDKNDFINSNTFHKIGMVRNWGYKAIELLEKADLVEPVAKNKYK